MKYYRLHIGMTLVFGGLETPSDFCYQCCSSLDFHLGSPIINDNKERLGIDIV